MSGASRPLREPASAPAELPPSVLGQPQGHTSRGFSAQQAWAIRMSRRTQGSRFVQLALRPGRSAQARMPPTAQTAPRGERRGLPNFARGAGLSCSTGGAPPALGGRGPTPPGGRVAGRSGSVRAGGRPTRILPGPKGTLLPARACRALSVFLYERGAAFGVRAEWEVRSWAPTMSRKCPAEEENQMVMHLAALPDERAASDPGGPCLADGGRELDNATFAAEVRRVSGALVGMGIGRGDVVAVVLPNSVELVTIMFAAWRLGAALTPVNPALTKPEVQYQLTDSGARLVVADDSSLSKVEGGVARVCVVDELLRRDGATDVDAAEDGARRAGLDDLHGRDDWTPEGCDARPRQPRGDGGDDRRLVRDDRGRSLSAGVAIVPCQRDHGQCRLAARGGRLHGDRPEVRPEDVLGSRGAGPAHVFLRGADDLRDADGAAGGGPAGHRLAAVRGVRSRADARRGDSCVRGSLRRCDPRGIRPIGGDGCDDGKSLDAVCASPGRWVCRCQGRRSGSSARTTSRCRPDRWAK